MHLITDFIHSINPHVLLANFGYVGFFVVIFVEVGLFLGFFLPGDSLLVTAGILAAAGLLRINTLLALAPLAAFLGDNTAYWIGRLYGRKLFNRQDSRLFKRHYVHDAEEFYAAQGSKAVILARFVPIVRTFAPPVAGIAAMDYKLFALFDAIGCLIWGISVTYLSYRVGAAFPDIDRYIQYVVIVIIAISFIPVVLHWHKSRRNARGLKTQA